MKSMSISAHGSETLACVCRCSSGLSRTSSPPIHILAGEKVCIHAMTPRHASEALASRQTRRMASASVSTGFQTTRTGSAPCPSSRSAICRDWVATCCSASSPYSPWLPVRNQTSLPSKVSVICKASVLSVDVLVPLEEPVDGLLRDRLGGSELEGEVRASCHVLGEDGGLHRVLGVAADGEEAVVAHQDRARTVPAQRVDDPAADGVVTDDGERPDRDGTAELVGGHGQHAGDLLAACRPGTAVRGVRVDDATDLLHVPVHVGVRGRVAGGRELTVDQVPVEV